MRLCSTQFASIPNNHVLECSEIIYQNSIDVSKLRWETVSGAAAWARIAKDTKFSINGICRSSMACRSVCTRARTWHLQKTLRQTFKKKIMIVALVYIFFSVEMFILHSNIFNCEDTAFTFILQIRPIHGVHGDGKSDDDNDNDDRNENRERKQ